MAGVTPEGYIPKTFDQLVEELAARAKEEFGEDFPTTPDSVFGQLTNVFAESSKGLWDLGQAVADQGNRDTAEGIYLDYLAGLVGLTRIPESGSTGEMLFTGNQGAFIPAFFPCKDELARNVITDDDLTLNRAQCYQSTFSVVTVANNTDYTITVEGTSFVYTSTGSATEDEILSGLEAAINTGSGYSALKVDTLLVVTLDDYNNTLTTTNSVNLNLDSVGGLVNATAALTGALSFPANTITELGASNLNVTSVTNPRDFLLGRQRETDEELRIRMALREQSTGTATKPAIEASLSEVVGVTGVLVNENITLDTDSNGVPAKAYETFVVGGAEDDIAEVIWRTKPAGIETFGDITKVVIDENGDEQVVKFSRKSDIYAWVRVTYSINSEEQFPANGEQQMKDAVVTFGTNLDSGEDFEPTKFYAPLYTVQGVYIDNIEIATTNLPTDTPVYQTTRIPVSTSEALIFADDRVPVTT